jgi:hypothetical protein
LTNQPTEVEVLMLDVFWISPASQTGRGSHLQSTITAEAQTPKFLAVSRSISNIAIIIVAVSQINK